MSNLLVNKTPEIPSVFDDFFKPWSELFSNGGSWPKSLTIPAVNIAETSDHYKVSLAAPDLKKEDFRVDIEDNTLIIRCDKTAAKEEKEARYTRKEYNYSSFTRSFSLPDDVKQDKIEANYENGVLKLTLPKKEETRKMAVSKRIAVN